MRRNNRPPRRGKTPRSPLQQQRDQLKAAQAHQVAQSKRQVRQRSELRTIPHFKAYTAHEKHKAAGPQPIDHGDEVVRSQKRSGIDKCYMTFRYQSGRQRSVYVGPETEPLGRSIERCRG